jgi:CBS domain-containing protein
MKIRDVMTRNVEIARPDEPVQVLAQRMSRGGFGFMPVCDGRTVVGTITDRDLTIRVLASGAPGSTPAAVMMTHEATVVHEDDDLEEVVAKMGDEQLRRLPVVNARREIIGVVSIGDLAPLVNRRFSGKALEDISKPTGAANLT